MNTPQTCGEGLAQRAALPQRLSDLASAIADNLQRHERTLDVTDRNAAKELEVYESLASEYREIAARLEAIADRMAGYRDLPMARHDERALASPAIREALVRLVEHEQDVAEQLNSWIAFDRAVLGAT